MNLETINYKNDTGCEAIKKLDRNQREIGNEVDNNAKQINVLSSDRGYLTAKLVPNSIATEILTSGKYIISSACTDKPESGTHIYTCDATFEREGYGTLILKEYSTGSKLWYGHVKGGVLQPWQQITTTTKTVSTYSTLLNGFINTEGTATSTKTGNVASLNVIFKNPSVTTANTSIIVVIEGFRPSSAIPIKIYIKSSTPSFFCLGWLHPDGRVYAMDVSLQANVNYLISETYIV